MGGKESKQAITGAESTDELHSISSSSSNPTLSRFTAKKKKRESHMVGGSVTHGTMDTKFGLPEDSDLAMPPEEEFLPSFVQLLDELGLPQPKREAMMKMPAERKWTLLLQQKGREYLKRQVSTKNISRKPEEFLDAIKSPERSVNDFTTLEVSLRSETISWVSKFLQVDGLNALLTILTEIVEKDERTTNDVEILSKAILCMKALMNNSVSLTAVLEDERGITTLVMCLSCANLKMKTVLLELLGAVCFVPPDGLQQVLAGFTTFREQKREQFRFQSLLYDLRTVSNIDYQVTCVSFCNAIANSSNDLELRIHLRNELIDLGMEQLIEDLRGVDEDDLQRQLSVFEDEATRDEEMISDRYGVVNINMTDPAEIFNAIRAQVSDSNSYSWFLRTFQQLMLIPASRRQRPHYWRLLNSIISQVVLQRNGQNQDISYFEINVEAILQEFHEREEFEKTKQIIEELEKQVVQQDKELKSIQEDLRTRDQEYRELEEKFKRQSEFLNLHVQEAAATKYKLKQKEAQGAAIKADIFNWDELKFPLGIKVTEEAKTVFKNFAQSSLEKAIAKAQEEAKIQDQLNEKEAEEAAKLAAKEISEKIGDIPAGPGPQISGPPPPSTESTGGPPPPPPPPPGEMGGPPPPPPPGMGGPPPPPGMGGTVPGLPPKPKITPKNKLKALHWPKLPEMTIPKTFWDQPIDEETIRKKVDLNDFEDQFKIKAPVVKSADADSEKKKKEKMEINVIDGKRSYNISIMLSRIKLTFSEIKKAIIGMEEGFFTEQMLKNFLEHLPLPEEYESLQIYLQGNNAKNLGMAEQFFVEMMRIDRYEQRIRAMYFKRRFQERIAEITPNINSVYVACQEVKTSVKLKTILELLLALGNYLNAGTNRGGAYGFKISFLGKIADTKGVDGKYSLLHYIQKVLETNYPGTESIRDELGHVETASKVNLNNLLSEVHDLKNGLRIIDLELVNHKNSSKGDNFYYVMNSFVERSLKTMDSISQKISSMTTLLEETVKFFGEEVKENPPDIFFGIFNHFIISLEKAAAENKLEIERIKLAEKRKLQQEDAKKKKSRPRGNAALNDESRNVMDDLIATIRSGAVFDRTDEKDTSKDQRKKSGGEKSKSK